jgi:hypothetical protein
MIGIGAADPIAVDDKGVESVGDGRRANLGEQTKDSAGSDVETTTRYGRDVHVPQEQLTARPIGTHDPS